MSELFGRRVVVELGRPGGQGIRFGDPPNPLRISFSVNHTGGRHPSRGHVLLYNVAPSVFHLVSDRKSRVRVLAGYGDQPRLVFAGNPVRDGVRYDADGSGDRRLSIEARDGGAGYTGSYVARTFTEGVTVGGLVDWLRGVAGWGAGEFDFDPSERLPGSQTITDRVPEVMDRIAKRIGGAWFVQDEKLYVKRAGSFTRPEGPLLSQDAGNLIGVPTPTRKGVSCTALLDTNLRPLMRFEVQHQLMGSGRYVATEVSMTGDTGYGGQFYMDVTGKRLGAS